jgi:hypothetical protein
MLGILVPVWFGNGWAVARRVAGPVGRPAAGAADLLHGNSLPDLLAGQQQVPAAWQQPAGPVLRVAGTVAMVFDPDRTSRGLDLAFGLVMLDAKAQLELDAAHARGCARVRGAVAYDTRVGVPFPAHRDAAVTALGSRFPPRCL